MDMYILKQATCQNSKARFDMSRSKKISKKTKKQHGRNRNWIANMLKKIQDRKEKYHESWNGI